MPTVTFDHSTIRWLQSETGGVHDPELWDSKLGLLGCCVDHCDEETIEIEVFPDRPDLLSVETMTHAARSFLHGANAEPELPVVAGDVKMTVDPSLKDIRPIILGAVVRGVDTGHTEEARDAFIQGLMDHQEKLHFALGRGRKRSSIGVHDLASLHPPFRVVSVPKDYAFVPLAMTEEMTVEEILTEHPKGVEYAHLLDGMDAFPVIIDAGGDVLSFPPIINGDHTTVTTDTRDFFIDVTGWDMRACEASLLLICLSFAIRGGKVESIEITDCGGTTFDCPIGKPKTHSLPKWLLEEVLGREFDDNEVAMALNKMGARLVRRRVVTDGPRERKRWADAPVGEDEYLIEVPRWRADVLHPVDLVEEIATGIGYEELGVATSRQSSAGIPLAKMTTQRRIRDCLQAAGMQQIQSLTLSNEEDQFTKIRLNPIGEYTVIHNAITTEHTIMRQRLLPSLLRLLSANRHHELPQRIYELGTTVQNHHNVDRVSWLCAEVGSGFTGAKGLSELLLRDLGAYAHGLEVEYQAIPEGIGPWLNGRGAYVMVEGVTVGEIGEIDPSVADCFDLRVPLQAGEFDLNKLEELIPDPVL